MIDVKEILKARKSIADIINKTPIFSSTEISTISGNSIFIKGEHLQKTGSFKIRGAANKVKHAVEQGAKYITTASSGNHGQAVAYVANTLNVPATIVVPSDVNVSKESAIKAYNGIVEKCGKMSSERLPRAEEIARLNEGVYIPPYDDPYVISGQGTIGLEIMEQLEQVDVIVVPIGGGGLLAGILAAVKAINPAIKVIGVEPDTAHDTYLSLKNGKITPISGTTTIADGLRTSQPGEVTFQIIQKYIDDLVLVSEAEIRQALFLTLERTKQLIEPSSAVTVAAALFDKLGVKDKNVVCVASGGNVDLRRITNIFPE